ncbi:uncharacterized protein K02A2.6-like [Polypterus senegalus]|uniref:uncharacterized protein K02A2.6-like n=1 Tax=Polypterus senegalus TaxID=55291 RepID=UPI001964EA2F|nr:uncharacterized protein K02A2.6-like [Polypterus senegalus]
MATLGRIDEFNAETGVWEEYAERLECFFHANDIDNPEKKRSILLSVCGAATYSTLRSLLAPTPPCAVPYRDIVECLQRHYNPAPSEIVQRFHFHSYKQLPNQSMSCFIAELRKLSVHCNFGEQLEQMLRDRIVCGVADPLLLRQLLAEPKLTFKIAEERALAAEMVNQNAQMLRTEKTLPANDVEEVHKMIQSNKAQNTRSSVLQESDGRKCFRCGGTHTATAYLETTALETQEPSMVTVNAQDEYVVHISPKFFKARPVPFALKQRIDEALDDLVEQGIFIPVRHSKWATPIVPVTKRDGSLRICGDYRCTVNTAVKPDVYPLPTVAEMFSTLAGGVIFTKLDLKQAYQQLVLDEPSAELLTINTHRGLYRAQRLQFGVSTAVAIFQRFMDTLLAGIPGVQPYLDDILITGKTPEEHDTRLEKVLCRISEVGLRLQKEKCVFAATEVEFLGFRVDKEGIHPTSEKVEAIMNAPAPRNKTQLQAFLGLLNFYSFLPNKATILEPMHRLLDKSMAWHWAAAHDTAYKRAKALLKADGLLVHYDVKKPLVLVCDASPYGLGAVLSHVEPDGMESPISFASRTLSATERNYAQIDKEALAVIFGVKKFHQFLQGRQFTICTDHKPLLGLLHHSKPMPQLLSPRMLRWSLLLGAYNYQLCYRPGKELTTADALSRLPIANPVAHTPPPLEVLLLESVPNAPIHGNQIAALTQKDPVLSRVLHWLLHGWPHEVPGDDFIPFTNRQNELSTHKGCVLWGSRVVVPVLAREDVLKLLHDSHPGIVHMKALARSYVWWPGMDGQIEKAVKCCRTCQQSRHAPSRAPLHPWEWPAKAWSRIHIDFGGPFQGKVFFILVDSHSKWLEVSLLRSMSANAAIDTLRLIFATHGLPDIIVSDNGAAFTSVEFKEFTERNGIRHVTTAPYHPSSNGQAERMVQTTKDALRRIIAGNWQTRLARFLLSQHTMPNSSTGKSPAELLMKRRLTTALDRLNPDFQADMHMKQGELAQKHEGVFRQFRPLQTVYARNFVGEPQWMPAVVQEATGPVSYRVQTEDGHICRRHVDQLRERMIDEGPVPEPESMQQPVTTVQQPPGSPKIPTSSKSTPDNDTVVTPTTETGKPVNVKTPQPMVSLRPRRALVKPRRYKDI